MNKTESFVIGLKKRMESLIREEHRLEYVSQEFLQGCMKNNPCVQATSKLQFYGIASPREGVMYVDGEYASQRPFSSIFTLIHEYTHLILHTESDTSVQTFNKDEVEARMVEMLCLQELMDIMDEDVFTVLQRYISSKLERLSCGIKRYDPDTTISPSLDMDKLTDFAIEIIYKIS